MIESTSEKHLCNTCTHRQVCKFREPYAAVCKAIYGLKYCTANLKINRSAEPPYIEECKTYSKQGKPGSVPLESGMDGKESDGK